MESKKDIILWGAGTNRTMRAHWALHELSLSYQCKPISSRTGETQTIEYTTLNPRQKIPLLQDGNFTIGESAAIVAYLARTYGDERTSMIPTEPRDYAHWLEWCFFVVTELDSTSLYVMRRHMDLKDLYGDAPEVVSQAALYFQKQLIHVSEAMRDGRLYLCGDRFTSADIMLTTCLTWATFYKVDVPASFHSYLKRIAARPGYQSGFLANLGPQRPGESPMPRVGDFKELLELA